MAIGRPFRRTYRAFVDGKYSDGGRSGYVLHPKFAQRPGNYVRAFELLQKDLFGLFEYIEPSDNNGVCYSYRTHALLLRACIEVEANCKAILKENGYDKTTRKGEPRDLNIDDYRKINVTHRLSSYQVKVPYWQGETAVRAPFSPWANGKTLTWYDAYNATKHDRSAEFARASFATLIDACCGVVVILAAQFGNEDFSPLDSHISIGHPIERMVSALGGYFRIKYPDDWPLDLRYDFDWQALKNQPDPFAAYDYAKT
jgi:hypothetical protein